MRALTSLFALSGLLLTACAPLRDPWGLALSRGLIGDSLNPPMATPDSLQADVSITPREQGLVPFTARVYAKPNHAYRIDAFGFPSLIAASYQWVDGQWKWVRHDSKQVWEGAGNQLELEGSPLQLPDVHAVLGFLWGRVLPGFFERDSLLVSTVPGEIRWKHHGETWVAQMDQRSGFCREVRSSSFSMRYSHYARYGDRILPREVEVLIKGASVMVLGVREIKDGPVWKKNPFSLSAPAGYQRL